MTINQNLSRISLAIGIVVTVVTFITGGVRIMDLSTQTATTVDNLIARIDEEHTERVKQDAILKDAIVKEREDRNAEYTKIQVKLTEIDTRLLYIQQSIDTLSIGGNDGTN